MKNILLCKFSSYPKKCSFFPSELYSLIRKRLFRLGDDTPLLNWDLLLTESFCPIKLSLIRAFDTLLKCLFK